MAKVNLPSLIIPKKYLNDPELRNYEEVQANIIRDLYTRSGGGTDNFEQIEVDLAVIEADIDDLQIDVAANTNAINTLITRTDNLTTLSGVPTNSTNLGSFSGVLIPNNSTIKDAFQTLETQSENNTSNITGLTLTTNALVALSGVSSGSTSLGTFSGTTIPDNSTVYAAFQSLETSLETKESVNGFTNGSIPFVSSDNLAQDATGLFYNSGTFTFNTKNAVFDLVDNTAAAFSVKQSTNNYFKVDTTNSSEKIEFGNTTTNPQSEFLGTGLVRTGGNISSAVATTLTTTASLTAASTARYIRVNGASGSFTVTLPAASTATGVEYTFNKVDAANTVTIDGNGSETIDGNASLILNSLNSTLTIWCDGSTWSVKEYFNRGVFTPILLGSTTAGTHTYSAQNGSYIRIKNQIIFYLSLTITAKDAAMAGNVLIGGLPFAYAGDAANIANSSVTSYRQIDLTANYYQVGGAHSLTSTNINLRESGDNNNFGNIQPAQIGSGFNISITGTYSV